MIKLLSAGLPDNFVRINEILLCLVNMKSMLVWKNSFKMKLSIVLKKFYMERSTLFEIAEGRQ